MKYFLIIAFLLLFVLASCSSNPVIIPDTTSENVIMLELKDKIAQPGAYSPSYGWLFWYAPLAILLVFWGYRHLIRKPLDCIEQEPNSTKVQEKIDNNPNT
jgi:hypothetical protein